MELLELEDGKLALGSLGMSDGFRLITDGRAAEWQSEPPGDWKMLAIWATFDEEGATELRILSNCFSPSVCLKESKSNQAETNKNNCRTTVVGLLAENL